MKRNILTGQRFGEWEVISYAGHKKYNCMCSCGIEKVVAAYSLTSGISKSCGHTRLKMYKSVEDEFADFIEDEEKVKEFNTGYENEIITFIKSIYNNAQFSVELFGYNILCYIPEKGIAINYYKSSEFNELTVGRSYFYDMSKKFDENGIRIIHIYDYEWFQDHKREMIKSILMHTLTPSIKIYARKTQITEMSSDDAMTFVNENHLQGGTGASVKIGLYYQGMPVAMMSFGTSRFAKEDDSYEIIRACYKQGYTVEGGVSKILNYFIKNYNPHRIISYSDIGKFASKSYMNAGLILSEITDPGYVWTKDGEELQRYQCMKKRLIAKGWGDESETENEIMRNHGYYKVYNAGNRKFLWVRQ